VTSLFLIVGICLWPWHYNRSFKEKYIWITSW